MSAHTSWAQTPDGYRCAIYGDLDLAAEARIRRELLEILDGRPRSLVIDLGGTEFIDSTGLRVLLSCRNRAVDHGTRLELANLGPAVRRTLEIANLTSWFEYAPSGALRPPNPPQPA